MVISVVIPLLNEQGSLPELHRRLVAVLEGLGVQRQIIFVDDGSTDGSPEVIRALAAQDPSVVGLRFSRNFGHEAASTAGLDAATGDAVILMDADLQDPPEVIKPMVERWQDGFEVVYAVRTRRQGESVFKRSTSWMFYRILHRLADVQIPMDTGDFRLIDGKVLAALKRCREQDRFVRGLVAWMGFRQTSVTYDRPARFAGETKYNPVKLLLLAIDAAVGFSIKPLRIATWAGFLVMLVSLFQAGRIFVEKIFFGIDLPGFALLAVGLFLIGGVHMLLLGVLGEYIGRIYRQTQARPLYIVAETIREPGTPALQATAATSPEGQCV